MHFLHTRRLTDEELWVLKQNIKKHKGSYRWCLWNVCHPVVYKLFPVRRKYSSLENSRGAGGNLIDEPDKRKEVSGNYYNVSRLIKMW